MPPDVFSSWTAQATTGLRTLLPAVLAALAGCATSIPTATLPVAPAAPAQPSFSQNTVQLPEGLQATAVASAVAPAATRSGVPTGTSAATLDPNEAWVVKFLLGYAERLRHLNPAELATEITALGEPGQQPLGQMQLALALTHTHQPVDTARALGLFQRVVGQDNANALPYKPLARLLAERLLDQRKLEDTVERQNQQLREQQRRVEQLTERLEAMRAIERSINTRPPTGTRLRPVPTP
jgi:hypothetical protein